MIRTLALLTLSLGSISVIAQQAKPTVAAVPKPVTPAVNYNATVFSYGNNNVSAAEFISVYKKNNPGKTVDYSEKSLNDYLKLYENFKLKVAEGKAQRIDTMPGIKTELTNYRKQLAKSYLVDKVVLDKMYKEAYIRSAYEVHVQHIMVKLPNDPTPKDTLEAYKRIKDIYKKLTVGKEDFTKTAKEYSDEPNAKNTGGDIGFVTAMQAFYPFENAVYGLSTPGQISKPFRTKVGYHIVKMIEKRATRGQILTQHVLVSVAKAAKEDAVATGKSRIENWKKLLQEGKITFDQLAKDSSDDKVSAQNDGKLPWFGTGKMVQEFEDQAFKLKAKGDISDIFRTDYGFHIVKLLDKRVPNSYEKDKDDIKRAVDKDPRTEYAKDLFIAGIKKEYKFSANKINYEAFKTTLDSALLKSIFKATSVKNDAVLVSMNNKNYTTKDFAKVLEAYQRVYKKGAITSADIADKTYPFWIDKLCNELAESSLEVKYPEFKTLMTEYADGVILFDITDKNVWSKAVNDTTGLKNYYNSHKEKYQWGSRVEATIFRCANEKSTEMVKELIAKNFSADSILKTMNKAETKGGVSYENGKYEKNNNKIIDLCKWEMGAQTVTAPNGVPCVVYIKNILSPSQKMLDEARGYVIADYQEELETTWMNSLRAKYPIKENQEVLKTLVK